MTGQPDFRLGRDEILDVAISILREDGLEAVSMRSVSARLGVSPIPLYSRVGNKDALLDAIAERLLADLAPPAATGESWSEYAIRWAHELRHRLQDVPDARLMLGARRWAYVEASKPLIDAMRAAGLEPDVAVRACRLVMWATVGFAVLEAGAVGMPRSEGRRPRLPGGDPAGSRGRLPGGDPAGVTAREADELFTMHVRYLVDGLVADAGTDRSPPRKAARGSGPSALTRRPHRG